MRRRLPLHLTPYSCQMLARWTLYLLHSRYCTSPIMTATALERAFALPWYGHFVCLFSAVLLYTRPAIDWTSRWSIGLIFTSPAREPEASSLWFFSLPAAVAGQCKGDATTVAAFSRSGDRVFCGLTASLTSYVLLGEQLGIALGGGL